MENKSLWSDTAMTPRFDALDGDTKCDALVIGGGMAGVLCAYMLTASGVDCILVEATRICGGITKGTTAKITAQHGLIYHKLLRRFGTEGARAYFEANSQAVQSFGRLCKEIRCDYEPRDSYIYSLDDERLLARELEALESIGAGADYVRSLPLAFETVGAVRLENQAQFHPLKFACGIACGLRIYENTKVRELGDGFAVTDRGKIHAQKIIIATHFPMLNKHGLYFMKLHQQRSYVLALRGEGLPRSDSFGMYLDGSGKGLSLRMHNDCLLLGGGGHRTGERGGGWRPLEAAAQSYYPKAKEAYRWAAQDCMTLDGVPYIGEYSSRTHGLLVATGFNKWGMSSSMVAAKLLRDAVLGKRNPLAELFSPSRSMLRPALAVNAAKTFIGLLTPTAPRCPHMGCALKYNREEHSWDCPCHGSRFTEDMQLIDNPATDDKR